ncbi:hypothetical protein GCM10023100_70260 [Actinocorallia cavernae]|uniref:Uncharacterized protein n=2 Tax=Actinomycetes TaxID=1760 RepID=A0ABP8T603_9ACTN
MTFILQPYAVPTGAPCLVTAPVPGPGVGSLRSYEQCGGAGIPGAGRSLAIGTGRGAPGTVREKRGMRMRKAYGSGTVIEVAA